MYDAIVVGARCAGSAVAIELSRRNLSVLLLDKDTFPSDMRMSTHLIHQRGVAQLARWGLREQVAATARPIVDGRFDLGPVTLTGAPPAVEGEDAAFAPRRLLLDDILLRAAADSGTEVREGCNVKDLVREKGIVQGIKAESDTGTPFVERARIVVGADGPSSRVASSAGAEAYNARPTLQGTAWMYWDNLPLDHFVLHLGDHEAVYAFSSSGGTTLIGVNWSIDVFREAQRNLDAAYVDMIQRLAPELAERLEVATRSEERLYTGATKNFFRKAYGPGWALVGDAHYKKDPCTAQGITDAFCDAQALAEAVHDGLGGKSDLARLLEAHERETVARAMPFYELTCEMAAFEPATPEQAELYEALQDNPRDTEAFLGMISTAVSPQDFFTPENIERILQS